MTGRHKGQHEGRHEGEVVITPISRAMLGVNDKHPRVLPSDKYIYRTFADDLSLSSASLPPAFHQAPSSTCVSPQPQYQLHVVAPELDTNAGTSTSLVEHATEGN